MTKSNASPPFFAHGPLGPWGRRLGFRWLFYFTLPIPWHPLVLPLALAAIVYMAGSGVVAAASSTSPDHTWLALLAVAAVMGVLLSIPVLCWFLFALGAPLIQGAVFLAAMVLLGVEAWYGRVHPVLAALPALFAGLFAVQLLGGRPWLARLRRQQARFEPLPAGQGGLVLDAYWHGARKLVQTCDVADIYCPSHKRNKGASRFFWITPAEADALCKELPHGMPEGWKLERLENGALLTWENAPLPERPLQLSSGKYRAPFWLVTGLKHWTARGADGKLRLLKGKPELVMPLPLAMLFHFTSISGSAYHRLVAGFVRSSRDEFDAPGGDGFAALFSPRPANAGSHSSEAFAEVMAQARAFADEQRERDEALRDDLPSFFERLHNIVEASPQDLALIALLEREPQHLTTDLVPLVLGWIRRLMANRDAWTIHDAASLLAAFPHALLKPHAGALAELFNSRKLALQWDLGHGFDIDSLPRDTPIYYRRVAGFGLLQKNPGLYDKLSRLDPRLARFNTQLRQMIDDGQPGLSWRYDITRRPRAAKG